MRQWLKRLQDEFLVRMAAIDAEAAAALAKEQEESTESNQEVEFSPSEKLEQQGYQESRNRRMDGCSVRVGTHVSFVAP